MEGNPALHPIHDYYDDGILAAAGISTPERRRGTGNRSNNAVENMKRPRAFYAATTAKESVQCVHLVATICC